QVKLDCAYQSVLVLHTVSADRNSNSLLPFEMINLWIVSAKVGTRLLLQQFSPWARPGRHWIRILQPAVRHASGNLKRASQGEKTPLHYRQPCQRPENERLDAQCCEKGQWRIDASKIQKATEQIYSEPNEAAEE